MKVKEYNIIVEKHADGLYRFILSNIKDEHKARDIVQDGFEKLWINHEEVSFEKAKSFLFKITYNRMIDVIRRDKKMIGSAEIFEINDDYYADESMELKEILNRALNKLSKIQKSVVLLRDYEGYSYEEIAEITGLNESQVKVYIFRARQYLKKHLGQFELI
jgi:RNA polymerase sigma factor (sigma-70 family)